MKNINLSILQPISLKEMDSVSLMKRLDTKFIVPRSILNDLLRDISDSYKILEIENNRLMTYESDYYDTKNNDFYLNHHNKILKRTKIRVRKYVESNLTFLEIKMKDSKGNTVKTRTKLPSSPVHFSEDSKQFIADVTQKKYDLHKSIDNSFQRFTLVSTVLKERVTIDQNLAYNNVNFNDNLAIIELKQEKLNRNSPLFKALKKKRIHPYSISKYCIGIATMYPAIKQNNFKHKIRTINKITA